MKNILLVATREYKQIAATRGFWVMLLVLPLVVPGVVAGTARSHPRLLWERAMRATAALQ